MSLENEILKSREGAFKSLLENICNKYHCLFQCFRMVFGTEEPGSKKKVSGILVKFSRDMRRAT